MGNKQTASIYSIIQVAQTKSPLEDCTQGTTLTRSPAKKSMLNVISPEKKCFVIQFASNLNSIKCHAFIKCKGKLLIALCMQCIFNRPQSWIIKLAYCWRVTLEADSTGSGKPLISPQQKTTSFLCMIWAEKSQNSNNSNEWRDQMCT